MRQVRLGRRDDWRAINRVEQSAGLLFEGTHMAWAVGEVTCAEELIEAADSETLWVAEDNGTVIGFLLGEVLGSDLHIWEIAVHREYQRGGTGRTLLDAALAMAASRGLAQATLTTDRTLPWNAPWYARRGFRSLPRAATPPRLLAQLASEREPHRRCAMVLALT